MSGEKRIVDIAVSGLRVESEEDSPKKIVGYAAVFDKEARIGSMFREVFRPGAFKRAISEGQDVAALINHDPSLLLGRTASGTLKLIEDKDGLRAELEPADTQTTNELVTHVGRGDVAGMSIAFRAQNEKWSDPDNKDGELREVLDADLYDVSFVTYPAYGETSVSLRTTEQIFKEHRQELDGADDSIAQEREDMRLRIELGELEMEEANADSE